MKNKSFITIVTPTYNRSEELEVLFESLLNQTSYNFEWLIIDDGSIDDTKEKIKTFKNEKFKVNYFFKENGGKHTAINLALTKVTSPLLFIVDSDDILVSEAIESINNEENFIAENDIAGLVFRKSDFDGNSGWYSISESRFKSNLITLLVEGKKTQTNLETAIVWKTSVIKAYPFPVFNGEYYVPESTVLNKVSEEYDLFFINKIIYLFEYLEDGLTKAGRKLRVKNPQSGIYLAKIMINSPKYDYKTKLKWMLLYVSYNFFAKNKVKNAYDNIETKFLYIILFPLGWGLYKYWSYKYLN